ncbi:MAG: Amino acid permease [Planctomycetes bacterium ADurb.Bin126]|nr:MAG: Amino acid permease [Planctomycetes bacterium ADurb.Bin126]
MESETRKFGTFLGVFTPSILTILGVIMYLRFGWVVANAGLVGALIIVVLCSSIALITALSASAVATNMRLGTGGEYYLISRSLGLTIGGAIGIPLFLCRTFSVTLYCYGLAEAIAMFWPAHWGAPPVPWLAAGFVLATTAIAGKSASLSLQLQLPLMVLVGLSLVALGGGVLGGPLRTPQWLGDADRLVAAGGFWTVLAVYFPAVTGFTAGIGMSGDLRDPQRSIPLGTLSAVGAGAAIYMLVPVLLAVSAVLNPELLGDINPQSPPVWTRVAWLGAVLIYPGMWAAILSSAFGSVLNGARVLQALARDGLAPRRLERTSRTGQPTVATWVGGAIALSAVALGNLNTVATVVTVFFLTLYMIINLVAAAERLVRDPSYRPTIRVPWWVSLVGVGGAMAVMFLINPVACVAALVLELVLWLYLRRRVYQASWGDVWTGAWASLVRLGLHQLTQRIRSPRSWRPHILLFADRLEERLALVRLASAFNQEHGLLTVCEVMTGRPEDRRQAAEQREQTMADLLGQEGILAFAEVDVVEKYETGLIDIAQANGVGTLRSNTIAFGWPGDLARTEAQLRVLRTLDRLGKATLIIHPGPHPPRHQRIDIWWRGKQRNGDLMLLLAHLLRLNPLWRGAEIVLRSIVMREDSREDMERSLSDLIHSVRIQARASVHVRDDDKPISRIVQDTSRHADLVFIGLRTPAEGEEAAYALSLHELVGELPTTVFVRNSGPFQGQLI